MHPLTLPKASCRRQLNKLKAISRHFRWFFVDNTYTPHVTATAPQHFRQTPSTTWLPLCFANN